MSDRRSARDQSSPSSLSTIEPIEPVDYGTDPGEPPEPAEPQTRPVGFFRRNTLGCLAVVVAVAIVAGIAYGGFKLVGIGKDQLTELFGTPDYKGAGGAYTQVQVQEGATTNAIAIALKRADVVKSTKAFKEAARNNPKANTIQIGYYRIRTHLPAAAALAVLLNPKNQVTTTVTIPEGFTKAQIVATLTAKIKVNGPSFAQVAANPKGVTLPSYANGSLEGVLFPATYKFAPDVTATQVFQAMVTRFEQSDTILQLSAGAKAEGITVRQAIVLASMVQTESANDTDAPKVARVFLNRLNNGYKLQSDATVVYALGRAGSIGHLSTTPAQRATVSPYNTYLNTGLPIGPISNPGDVALQAAIQPATGSWLYFTVVNGDTGATVFSPNEAGQAAAVKQLQTWCNASTANKQKCYG